MITKLIQHYLTSSALTLAVLTTAACGGQEDSLFGQNKNSRRIHADESRENGSESEDRGSLSLTMPAGHAQFANVANIEITVWSERYYNLPKKIVTSCSLPDCAPSYNPDEVDRSRPGVSTKPITRLVPYKAGEKATMSDIPSGTVSLRVRLLDASGRAQFVGWGSADVQKGQTATAVVYVSATPGTGSVDIIIKPENTNYAPYPEPMPLPGGFQNIPSTDPRVQKAATFALGRIKPAGGYTLKSVSQAAMQVVAGLNLAFTMEIVSGSTTEVYAALVYEGLDGTMTLTKSQALGGSSAGSSTR